jgi:hypothetical protein
MGDWGVLLCYDALTDLEAFDFVADCGYDTNGLMTL